MQVRLVFLFLNVLLFQFKCGFFVNIICVVINFICMNTYGTTLFGLNEFPEWAEAGA